MKTFFKIIRYDFCVYFFCLLIVSCAHIHKNPIVVEHGDRQTLFFTGKGVAVGIMMDAFLDGAGVAIGIAIDEGIAKDISLVIQKESPQFDIRNNIKKVLIKNSSKAEMKAWQKLTIDRYGFQIIDADFVVPVLDLTIICTNANTVSFSLDKDSMDAYKVELTTIKTDGRTALQLLNKGIEEVFQEQFYSLCKKNA